MTALVLEDATKARGSERSDQIVALMNSLISFDQDTEFGTDYAERADK